MSTQRNPYNPKPLQWSLFLLLNLFCLGTVAQEVQKQVIKEYFTPAQKQVKRSFEVLKSEQGPIIFDGFYKEFNAEGFLKTKGHFESNQPHGHWTYYTDAGQKIKEGHFAEGKTTGTWTFYHLNGKVKMEGPLIDASRQGLWKFYYESGELKQKGYMKKGLSDSNWKFYYEDGHLKGEAFFEKGKGYYREYFLNGEPKREGMLVYGESDSTWKYYYDNGQLKAMGEEQQGKKEGYWRFFDKKGNLTGAGSFNNGKESGHWEYYYPTGQLKSEGKYQERLKEGEWFTYYRSGGLKGKGVFSEGNGTYQEYYQDGDQKLSGYFEKGAREGTWHYWDEKGILEGNCKYHNDTGMYYGYYPDSTLKMKGKLVGGDKHGRWIYYKPDGTVAGYSEGEEQPELDWLPAAPVREKKDAPQTQRMDRQRIRKSRMRQHFFFKYFVAEPNELRAFILGSNPIYPLFGQLPLSIEYYYENRLGLEMKYSLIRSPFFRTHINRPDVVYTRGNMLDLRIKLYHPNSGYGLLYLSTDLRLNSLVHTAISQRETNRYDFSTLRQYSGELGLTIGTRGIKQGQKEGFTVDVYAGFGLGYRYSGWELNQEEHRGLIADHNITTRKLAGGVRLGFILGYYTGDRYRLRDLKSD